MISRKKFNNLKLKHILSRTDTDRVVGYEYLGQIWFGETYAFSHSLRQFISPFKTKSIALDLEVFNQHSFDFLIGKDIRVFCSKKACDDFFGRSIIVEEYSKDRKTYVYYVPGKNSYELGFTILNDGGLVYFTMETADIAYNKALHRTSQ